MDKHLNILIVSPRAELAQQLTDTYGEHFAMGDCHSTRSLHKAIQSHREDDYDMCLIWEDYPEEELLGFFSDYERLSKRNYCVFLQVKKEIPENFNANSITALGFLAVISPKATHADREKFEEVLVDNSFEEEVYRRKVDVNEALDVALREIDKAARDTKRGRKANLNTLSLDFIAMQTDFDQEVLNKYYENLTTKADEAQPENVLTVKIPNKVLERDLPKLSADRYTGASDRVWRKLQKRYGSSEE